MSEEEKVVPATEEKDEQPTETKEAEEKSEATEETEESAQLKAQLEKEREARKKAEEALAAKAFKDRERKREQEEEDDDKPLTKKDLARLLQEERENTKRMTEENETKTVVSSLSDNEVERELILEIYKNRTFPSTLTLEEKLQECYILANKNKILGENQELKRALLGKKTSTKGGAGTHHDEPQAGQPKIADVEAQEYARLGFKWNGSKRRFEKKLPDGRFLVKSKVGTTVVNG